MPTKEGFVAAQSGPATYDHELVEAIARRVRHVSLERPQGTVDEEVRPIPEDDREHVFDPRVLRSARNKAAGIEPHAGAGGLMCERHFRRETHLVTDGEVARDFRVVDLGDRGLPVWVLRPQSAGEGPAPALLFEHGGGFTVGWFGVYEAFLMAVADLAGCVVVFPEVRLAPESRYPAQVDDCADVLDWMLANASELGIDPKRVCVMGDSAGGTLANATALRRPEALALCVLLYAGVDIVEVPDWWGYDLYPVVDDEADIMHERVDNIKAWVGQTPYTGPDRVTVARNPEVSAAYATDEQLRRYPRTLVVCSEYDYLRPQDERFAARLYSLGVDTRLIRYAGMEHGFVEKTGVYPQAEDLANVLADEIRAL